MVIIDKVKTVIYKILTSELFNPTNGCSKCKRKTKHWPDETWKSNHIIAYDKILGEWVTFHEENTYVKICVMSGQITRFYGLKEDTWNKIKTLCRNCTNKHLQTGKKQCTTNYTDSNQRT